MRVSVGSTSYSSSSSANGTGAAAFVLADYSRYSPTSRPSFLSASYTSLRVF
jgi:hypothetical protein